MIGLLSYLPTIAYIPHLVYAFILLFIFLKYGLKLNLGEKSNFLIIMLIISLSAVNNIIHANQILKISDYLPHLFLILISLVASKYFSKKDAKILIYLIAFESLVVMAETIMGVSTFFTGLDKYQVFNDGDLMYFKRPLGLSLNSSIISLKIMIAFLLLEYYKLKGKLFLLMKIILIIGLFLTFNRTVIVTMFFFYSLLYSSKLIKFKANKYKMIIFYMVLISFIGVIMIYNDVIAEKISNQFTRNTGKVELSGRGAVWKIFWEYIQQNFFFGNGSFKYWLTHHRVGRTYHAHNSFLQVLASHGIWIFLLYILLLIKNLHKSNYIYVFTLLLYSVTQYGVFWGTSLMDIILFVFLFSDYKKKT